jgi:hypothetical protein
MGLIWVTSRAPTTHGRPGDLPSQHNTTPPRPAEGRSASASGPHAVQLVLLRAPGRGHAELLFRLIVCQVAITHDSAEQPGADRLAGVN